MIWYAISDGLRSRGEVIAWARDLLQAGIDMVQIREKDLSAGGLFQLTRAVLDLPNPHGTKVLLNSRADVALAAGAHGVHLPSNAISPASVRRISPPDFVIGVSCHTLGEVRRAELEGADFAVFGPVFEPLSKAGEFTPAGLEGLRRAGQSTRIPVLALGGIDIENAKLCQQTGAAGVAGISLFHEGQAPSGLGFRALRGG